MRELGALMNSIAGVNPDDDVAVLTETLKRVRTLDLRTSFPGQTVSQRCGPTYSPFFRHGAWSVVPNTARPCAGLPSEPQA